MKVLVVVDMQNDFIDGVLGTKEAQAIVNDVAEYIRKFDGEEIFFTKDTHYADTYSKLQEGRKLPVPHCLVGTEGNKLNVEVAKALAEAWGKGTYISTYNKSTFGCKELAESLYDKYAEDRQQDKEFEIELVGVCTDICVVSNALLFKAVMQEAEVVVYEKLCAGTTVDNHKAAIQTMKSCQVTIR